MTDDKIQTREFTVSIACNGAAFDGENSGAEIARILRQIAERIELDSEGVEFSMNLRDVNGNTVGDAVMTVQDYRR